MRPLTWPKVWVQLPSAREPPATVQPPPAESTQVPPTCQSPSAVWASARTGDACSSLKRKLTAGRAATGCSSNTLRIGLRSTSTIRRCTPGRSAATVIGTFIGSSAKAGPCTRTRGSNCVRAAAPRNSLRKSGHWKDWNGSPSNGSAPDAAPAADGPAAKAAPADPPAASANPRINQWRLCMIGITSGAASAARPGQHAASRARRSAGCRR